MTWTLADPVSGLAVPVVPVLGDITITHDRETGILYPLRGTSPFVMSGPLRTPTINTPPLMFTTRAALDQFVNLIGLGRRMVLSDDMGGTWPVRVDGGVVVRLLDTADRATKPRFEAVVKFVGVV